MAQALSVDKIPVPSGRWSDMRWPDQGKGNLARQLVTKCRILLDDEDVTSRCFYFDESNGVVGLYVHDTTNKLMVDGSGGVLKEWLQGKFELVLTETVGPISPVLTGMRGKLEGRKIVRVLEVIDLYPNGSEGHAYFAIELDNGEYIQPDHSAAYPDLTVGPWQDSPRPRS